MSSQVLLEDGDPESSDAREQPSEETWTLSTVLKDGMAFIPPGLMIALSQYVDYKIDPYQRNVFDYKDGPSISFPIKPSIVTESRLLLLAWIIPAIVICMCTVLSTRKKHTYHALLGLAEAAALSYTIVVVGKKCAGSLRPCFKAMCGWDENLQACMGDHFAVRDARQSFPSGHSAAASAGLGFLALFINRELLLLAACRAIPHTVVRPLALVPVLTAFLIAIARTVTYHHRFEDIAMGLFIGTCCAVVSFYGQPKALTVAPHHCDQDYRSTVTMDSDGNEMRVARATRARGPADSL